MSEDQGNPFEALEARVSQLESELHQLRTAVERSASESAPARPLPPPSWGQAPPQPKPPPSTHFPPPAGPPLRSPITPQPAGTSFEIDSEAVLKWGGVGLVVLAVGFAVSTAISRGWIGPELQLIGAVAVSAALIGVGLRLQPSRPAWTHTLCSGGVAALFTIVASNLFLDQLNNDVAFVCTAIIGVGGYGLARLVPSEWVGATTIFGGVVGWLVISDEELAFFPSWMFFLLLVATALVLSLDQRWFVLRLIALVVGVFATLAISDGAEASLQQILAFAAAALLYGALLWLPSIGDLTSEWQKVEIQLAAVAAPWAVGVIRLAGDLDRDSVVGSMAIATAAVTAAIGLVLRDRIKPAHFISILIGASVALSIGLAVLLSTTAAFVGLAVQGAGLVLLSRALGWNLRVLVNAAIVVGIAVIYAVGNMLEAWTDDVAVGDDIAHLAIIVAAVVAGWQTREAIVRQATGAVALGLVLIWLGSVLVHLPEGQAVVSVSWATVGIAVLVAGAVRKVPELGSAGLGVLALTIAKLLTVDLQEVDTLWRAGLFFVVGLGIMRLGFLLPKLTGAAVESSESSRPEAPAEPPLTTPPEL